MVDVLTWPRNACKSKEDLLKVRPAPTWNFSTSGSRAVSGRRARGELAPQLRPQLRPPCRPRRPGGQAVGR